MHSKLVRLLLSLLLFQSGILLAQERTANLTVSTAVQSGDPDININGTLIIKNSTTNWDAGGYSEDQLNYSTNGYAQVTVNELATMAVFGLSTHSENDNQTKIQFGIYLHSSNSLFIMEDGAQKNINTSLTYQVGDILRVERVGDEIQYSRIRSGVSAPIYTSTKRTVDPLIVDFALRNQNGKLENIQVSDSFHTSSAHPATSGTQNFVWADYSNLDYFGNKLIKTQLEASETDDVSTIYNSGAVSENRLNPGVEGWIKSTAYEASKSRAFGLSSVGTINTQQGNNTQVDDIDFAFILGASGGLFVREFGTTLATVSSTYTNEDELKVERIASGHIEYRKNGTLVRSTADDNIISSTVLYARVALKSEYSSIMDAEISSGFINPNVVTPNGLSDLWTDIEGITFVDDKIIKTSDTQWGNSGAASVAVLKPGIEGWVEMTVFETNTARTLGLSESNIDAGNFSIDFAIQLTAAGEVNILENGQNIYPTSGSRSYAQGDVFRIKRALSGAIEYTHTTSGGTTENMHINNTAPNTQLVADIALKDMNATITNVQFSESFQSPFIASHWQKSNGTVYYENAVAIGRNSAIDDFLLSVQGKIRTQGVKVTLAGWADFVFENGYDLKSLAYVKEYIKKNGHLPDVPSEKEVLADGIDLEKMDAILLRKIEELTLHMIKQNETLIEQNKQLLDQTKKIKELEKELKEIKKGK